jgi:hypothetical protein
LGFGIEIGIETAGRPGVVAEPPGALAALGERPPRRLGGPMEARAVGARQGEAGVGGTPALRPDLVELGAGVGQQRATAVVARHAGVEAAHRAEQVGVAGEAKGHHDLADRHPQVVPVEPVRQRVALGRPAVVGGQRPHRRAEGGDRHLEPAARLVRHLAEVGVGRLDLGDRGVESAQGIRN